MQRKKVLWLGWGRLARLAEAELDSVIELYSVARSPAERERHICADLSQESGVEEVLSCKPDVIIFTMSPDLRGEEAYRQSYLYPLQKVLQALEIQGLSPFVLCVSSSSVWGSGQGPVLSELLEAKPDKPTAKVLLEMEQQLRQSDLAHCIVRFSGIYGDYRFHLIRQVEAAKPGLLRWTNRIHEQDAAAVLVFLVKRKLSASYLPSLLVASDMRPCLSSEIQAYIAESLGLDGYGEGCAKAGAELDKPKERRIDNSLLCSLAYEFRYKSYRDAYAVILQQYKDQLRSKAP
ncbi:hypothetical protein [Agaribacterium sp. ZY112]|uniref:hypothetical protein n=1 Tax=Agaribacterium sp. ZY112 TaxID=3233574 RepID=UPI003526A4ED